MGTPVDHVTGGDGRWRCDRWAGGALMRQAERGGGKVGGGGESGGGGKVGSMGGHALGETSKFTTEGR